jgi:diacylglycerol kinase (ATP)
MSDTPRFSVGARVRSFRYAFRGIVTLLASQHNAWIHAVATVGACALGLALGISRLEWCAVLLVTGLVWSAEALNTALEFLCDAAIPENHPLVGKAKDTAAGAVLVAAVIAVAVAVLVFGPHLLG